MKKIIIALLVAVTITACQKEDDNGDLGGFWKLLKIEKSDGETIDTKEASLFWRVQLDLIQIGDCYGRFQHTGDSLFIQMIDVAPAILKEHGIENPANERFAVEHLSRKSMTLKSDYARLRFRKF